MAKSIFDKIKEFFGLKKNIAIKKNELDKLQKDISGLEYNVQQLKDEIDKIRKERDDEVEKTKIEIESTIKQYKNKTHMYEKLYAKAQSSLLKAQRSLSEINIKIDNQNKKIESQKYILKLIRSLQNKLLEIITVYSTIDINLPKIPYDDIINLNKLSPSFEVPLHSFDMKSLKALSKDVNKLINKTLLRYEKRFTAKSNRAIYQLMAIALRAELQNIMIGMKFSTIDKCKDSFNKMIDKYLQIVYDGNKLIAPTLSTFIFEIKTLFGKKIDIEYEYYVKKEQEKVEQQILREQMRQEMEERKELERQQKMVEKEEEKFKMEIEHAQEQLTNCKNNSLILQLQEKIKQLQEQLQAVKAKKEEIINLQNGKAGYVYIISNLGSFGNNRFKIGMTRRINPLERVNELGGASVPFKFDVHSFIFSNDAVGLERLLHNNLSEKRTNKVNLRKEFFDVSIDELEALVQKLDPTAEFNRTMLAVEYRKSLDME